MKLIYRTKQIILAIGDLLSFVFGFWLALLVRNLETPEWSQIELHIPLFSLLFLLWIIFNYINGLYDLERNTGDRSFYKNFAETTGLSLLLSIIFFYLLNSVIAPKTILLLNILFGYGLSLVWRIFYKKTFAGKALLTKVLMVGHSEEVDFLLDITKRRPEKGYEIVALVDPETTANKKSGVPVYHNLEEMKKIIAKYGIDLVIIVPHIQKNKASEKQIYELLFTKVQISDLPTFYEIITGRIPPSTFSEGWFLQHLTKKEKPLYDKVRIIIDYFVATILSIFVLAILPVIALLIKITSKGPVFIKQKRVGQNGREFVLYKFRSMYTLSADGSAELGEVQFATRGDKRITPIGRFLRKARIDELPQVLNLLKRDVTLIGPRPERPEIVRELEKNMSYYPLRHLVRPGLTGWALINQGYTDDYDKSLQKLQYDLYYIKNRSFALDIVISLRTLNVLLRLMGQ